MAMVQFKYKDIVKANSTAWVTGCTHAYHKNICAGSSTWNNKDENCRPYPNEVVMTETMVEKINNRVQTNDTLFILGDIAFGGKQKDKNIETFLSALKCNNIYICKGNHDEYIEHPKVKWFGDYLELRLNNGTLVCMFHYPIRSWNEMHHGSIHLYSHVHGKLDGIGRSMDIGMDTSELAPYSLDYCVSTLKELPIYSPNELSH